MSNPSSIWSQLSLPNPAVGSLPFVAVDNASIITDITNFYYSQLGLSAYVGSQCAHQLTVFGGLRQGYTDTTAQPGAATINKPSGRCIMAAGQSSIVITNSFCFATSVVSINIEGATFDATATRFQITPAAGSFTLKFNAASTGAITFSFDILNVF